MILQECPFCGRAAEIVEEERTSSSPRWFFARCVCCYGRTGAFMNCERAAEEWNRREGAGASAGALKVCAEILQIMKTYHEQWPNVSTPGGLEHMGDVWRLLGKWEKLLEGQHVA